MKTTIEIQNLKCGGCAHSIKTKAESVEGISGVIVNEETFEVTFAYESESSIDEVKNQLAKIGYPTVGDDNTMVDKAKSYVSCAIGKVTKD